VLYPRRNQIFLGGQRRGGCRLSPGIGFVWYILSHSNDMLAFRSMNPQSGHSSELMSQGGNEMMAGCWRGTSERPDVRDGHGLDQSTVNSLMRIQYSTVSTSGAKRRECFERLNAAALQSYRVHYSILGRTNPRGITQTSITITQPLTALH
jgi:hypothetical protein